MRQARLKAASTQRPTRVVIHCKEHEADVKKPCVFTMQGAIYDNGVPSGWGPVPVAGQQTRHEMNASILARAAAGTTPRSTTPATPWDPSILWIIFMPSSRVEASHEPYVVEFVPEQYKAAGDKRGLWSLSVNASSGRTTLNRVH
ncbi:MAG: hypothetical protein LBV79_09975 [Candidatus Adiutrix sp.]|jgi:hypothetical protein|nr:hypothetical protein [Candidatus Adiutrix sp.]